MERDTKEILTIDDLGEMLLIGRNSAYKLLSSGKIKAFRIGNRIWKIPKSSVYDYINNACKHK